MAHIQQQIKENSMEMQDYLRELRDWEAKAKAKDQMLKGVAAPIAPAEVPPIRGQQKKGPESGETRAEMETTVRQKREGDQGRGKSAASHTYDYFRDKWDKFDMDKALAEADAESPTAHKPSAAPPPKPSQNEPPITSPAAIAASKRARPASSKFAFSEQNGTARSVPPEATVAELKPQTTSDAVSEKEEGNCLFKAGRFREALECYGRSIALSPTSVAYANRAMAALKLDLFREAEDDCTAAVDLDGQYVKAYSRRGRARLHLGKWLEATDDFEYALRLEPHNKELLQEYTAARAACERDARLAPSPTAFPLSVKRVGRAPDALILEQSPGVRSSSGLINQESTTVAHEAQKDAVNESISESVSARPTEEVQVRPEAVAKPRADESGSREKVTTSGAPAGFAGHGKSGASSSERAEPRPEDGATLQAAQKAEPVIGSTAVKEAAAARNGTPLDAPGGHVADGGTSSPSSSTPGHSEAEKKSPRAVQRSVLANGSLAAANAAAEKLRRTLAENVATPRTSYEFEAQWKGFKDDAAAKAKLLKTLSTQQLAPFFKESLQAPLLCDMLRVVARELLPGDATFAADLLEGLSTVPRFGMTVMFISSKDKQSLRELWDTGAINESIPKPIQSRLALCRAKYRM